MPGFIKIVNESRSCLAPTIDGVASITVTTLGAGGVVGTGTRTETGNKYCIPPGVTVYGFVPDVAAPTIGAVGYGVPSQLLWRDAPLAMNGSVPFHLLNAISADGDMQVAPSRISLVCKPFPRDMAEVSRDHGIPTLLYAESNPSCR